MYKKGNPVIKHDDTILSDAGPQESVVIIRESEETKSSVGYFKFPIRPKTPAVKLSSKSVTISTQESLNELNLLEYDPHDLLLIILNLCLRLQRHREASTNAELIKNLFRCSIEFCQRFHQDENFDYSRITGLDITSDRLLIIKDLITLINALIKIREVVFNSSPRRIMKYIKSLLAGKYEDLAEVDVNTMLFRGERLKEIYSVISKVELKFEDIRVLSSAIEALYTSHGIKQPELTPLAQNSTHLLSLFHACEEFNSLGFNFPKTLGKFNSSVMSRRVEISDLKP
jgi:hypothetical protein